MEQVKAKIFLADERGMNEASWFRSFNTFNFGKYFNEHKFPIGDMYVANDDSLDAGRSLRMMIEDLSYVILLPVIGAIGYKDSSGNDDLVAAGQAKFIAVEKVETIEISNPFDDGLVNFLQIWVKADKNEIIKGSHLSTYDVNECLNGLVTLSPESLGASILPFSMSIGKFEGRGETNYRLRNKEAAIFLFVIEGAFEVQGRLLHARDGLAIWETEEVEMEALSNDAIILIMEITL